MKYDHHCGMVMNCIGINNYHIFIQFMFLTMCYFISGAYLNIKYNMWKFWIFDWVYIIVPLLVLVMQIGSAWYAYSMLKWYYEMACKNMHAIEQSITGTIYNKAQYWGLLTDEKDKAAHAHCCSTNSDEYIYLYTKKSRSENFMSML